MKYTLLIASLFTILVLISCRKDKTPEPKVAPMELVCKDTVSYQQVILPVIQDKCYTCHANGTQPVINDYNTTKNQAALMLKTFTADGVSLMPQGGPALPAEYIKSFNCWIQQGKLNN